MYFDLIPPVTIAEYIINDVYTGIDGENGLYYHDGIGSYTNADQEAGDSSYRFSGADPNNYVCFGSDLTVCPADNLYRIIGVFNRQVKLIKYDYANSNLLGNDGAYNSSIYSNNSSNYYKGYLTEINRFDWGYVSEPEWSESVLNIGNLNTNYIENIGSEWANMIDIYNWNNNSVLSSNVYSGSMQSVFNAEKGNYTYSVKVGLTYLNEYGYASNPSNWNLSLRNFDSVAIRNNNWMFMGLSEWTNSTVSSSFIVYDAYWINESGSVEDNDALDNGMWSSGPFAVRPTFYLKSTVTYVSGDGSIDNPYRIA